MQLTKSQVNAFLNALLGSERKFEDGEGDWSSPRVVAFLNGALPQHGCPHVWRIEAALYNNPMHVTTEAKESFEEFTQFLEAIVKHLRNPKGDTKGES